MDYLKLSDAQRLRWLACQAFDEGKSIVAVAGELGVAYGRMRRWKYLYNAHGLDVFVANGQASHKKYSYDTKLAAVRDVEDHGMRLNDVVLKYGLSSATLLRGWLDKYRSGGAEALVFRAQRSRVSKVDRSADTATRLKQTQDENQLLRARLLRREAEIALLKKARALGMGPDVNDLLG